MVGDKKAYPLRINVEVMQAMQRWANDELRSLNAQIEFVLRSALRQNGRLPEGGTRTTPPAGGKGDQTGGSR